MLKMVDNTKIVISAKRKPPNAGKGRAKGSMNKVTRQFKETVSLLLEDNAENVAKWLKNVAEGDAVNEIKPDPYKALDMLAKLAEYATPKLARTEVSGTPDGAPIQHAVQFTVVDPKDK
ncbi:MAG: hypothetical protein PHT07_20640 [Paludibacter sp.]|nr:hypothetical protein [Paludibacter sp.]